MTASDFLAAAEELAEQIWARRVCATDESVAWLDPEAPTRARLGVHLYDGVAGISLFLAVLGHVLGNGEHRRRSLLALAPVRSKLAAVVADPERASRLQGLGLGGFRGIGSLIYSFLRIGRWTGEPELVAEAHRLLDLITPERIASDRVRDVLLGSAGGVLALATLHRDMAAAGKPCNRLLELASACARPLLADRSAPAGLPRAWKTLPGFPELTGFAHGAAGICYALLRLHEINGEPEILEAAREGLAFERACYDPEHGNWKDTRYPEEPRFELGWCYGAPGISLGRLGALHIMDDPRVYEEIRSGLETTRARSPLPQDHVCCGNMGRVDVLLQASERLGDGSLGESARELATSILARARANGRFLWRLEAKPDLFDPSFFTGASGVGYVLLRLAAPQSLPCVLLLD